MIHSKFISIRLILLFILPATLTAQSGKSLEVLNAESRRFLAMIEADTAALRPMLADDLIYVHSNALKETKSTHLAAIGSKKLVYKTMDRQDVQVRVYAKTVLVNGTLHVKGILNDNAFEVQLLYSAMYHKKRGVWQLANWQSTKLP